MTFRHPPSPQPIRPGGTGVKIPISGRSFPAITRRGERGWGIIEWMISLCVVGLIMAIAIPLANRKSSPSINGHRIDETEYKGHAYIIIDVRGSWLHAAHCPCLSRVKWGTNTLGEIDDYREDK